jgi:hypothetical protein
MRYTPIIGSQDDEVAYQSVKPYPATRRFPVSLKKASRNRGRAPAVPVWSVILWAKPLFLAKALKKTRKDTFDKMIVFLGWDHGQRTNTHVERNTRVFRMMQKTRYKRRKSHTIAKALALELSARMLEHPLYPDKIRARPVRSREAAILQMAA